jgi:hypothetical protein
LLTCPPPSDTTAPAAPVITSPANNTHDIDGSFTISGTAEANSTVEVFEGTASRGTTATDASGTWSVPLSGVTEGNHTYAATAKDAAGNVSARSNPLTIIVDKSAQTAPRGELDANTLGLGESVNAYAFFPGQKQAQTFTAERNGKVTTVKVKIHVDSGYAPIEGLKMDITTVDPATGLPTSNVLASTTIPSSDIPLLPVNTNPSLIPLTTLTFENPATAQAGGRYAIVIDTIAPDAPLHLLRWTTILQDYSGGQGMWINDNGSFAGFLPARPERDNVSDQVFATYVTPPDTTPPDTALGSSGPSGTTNSASASFAFSSTEEGSTFECSLDGSAFEACSSPKEYTDLAEHAHTFEVRATNAAGTDPTPATRTWTVDTTAPAAPVISTPADNSFDTDGSFPVSGTAEAGTTVTLSEGTLSKGTATADGTGNWSIVLTGVTQGSHTYFAKAQDAVGNTSIASNAVKVIVDTKAPTVKSLVATNRTTTGVPRRNTNFQATFSEKMNANTLNKSTYKLYRCPTTTSTNCTTQITNVTVTPRTDGLGATLNPYGVTTTLLSANTRYKVVVTQGAKDAAGNALDQNPSATGNQPKVTYFKTGSS